MEIQYELFKAQQGAINAALSAVTEGDEHYSQPERLGQLVASFYEWNGYEIMIAFEAALTDANFHSEAEQVRNMRIETFGQ